MGLLIEQQVQKRALEFLSKRYRLRARWGRLVARPEVRTRRKYGGKRADGLITFKHWLLGTYVVSLEAKSRKTLPAIKPKPDWTRLIWNSLKFGMLCCLISGAYLALFKTDDVYLRYATPLNVLVATALAYGFFTSGSYRHRRLRVIDQLRQYPANEQWIAFSADGYEAMNAKKQKQLRAICKAQGVGILKVSRYRTRILCKPKTRWRWFGDFLGYYSAEKKMRAALDGKN